MADTDRPDATVPPEAADILEAFLPFAALGIDDARLLLGGLVDALRTDPDRVRTFLEDRYSRQLALWQQVLGDASIADDAAPADARFRDPAWHELPWFRWLRRQHALWTEFATALPGVLELSPTDRRRLAFALRQWADAVSPTNFLGSNPSALRRAFETEGQSVARGVAHWADDLARGRISMSDEAAFRVGVDLATTPGDVIHESPLAQLIHYTPTTPKLRARPLLIVPPFINKYYILDLRPENSFVRFAVEQGFEVFMVSWRNVGPGQGDATWDDYVREGVLDMLDVVLAATRSRQAGVLGFCVGGTLAATAAALDATTGRHRIADLTLLATLLDFADPGDIGVYVDSTFVERSEDEFRDGGVMPGTRLAAAFASLRARDLVWHFVEHNYLLGDTPPPFDLLHWNGDGTNLPGRLYCQYLRGMYLENRLRIPGGLSCLGHPVDLGAIDVPTYLLAAKDDHIVPWRSAFESTRLVPGADRFVLAESGHVAGVVNPATTNRRGFWHGPRPSGSAGEWLATAQHTAGSWWHDWAAWHARRAGRWKAIHSGAGHGGATRHVIEAAPGRYVLEQCHAGSSVGDSPRTTTDSKQDD